MNETRRAAIVTPYGLFNYGNRLQNYAVDVALKARGYEVETLILKREYPKSVLRELIKHVAHRFGLRGVASLKYLSFLKFDRDLSARRVWSQKHLSRIAEQYDLVVCGSDQIWNPYQIDFKGAEYGLFAPNARKVAISPSFGIDEIPQDRWHETQVGLNSFDALSTREFSGQKIIEKATGSSAPVLIDPTMSLTAEQWRTRSDGRMVPKERYVFVYLLGEHSPGTRDQIQSYADNKGLKIVTLMNKEFPRYYAAGPQDFLSLIDNATSVIADSFHAAVFSQLFNTPLYLVSRTDGVSMSSRFDTFQQLFNLQYEKNEEFAAGRFVRTDREDFLSRLTHYREQFGDYLTEALA